MSRPAMHLTSYIELEIHEENKEWLDFSMKKGY